MGWISTGKKRVIDTINYIFKSSSNFIRAIFKKDFYIFLYRRFILTLFTFKFYKDLGLGLCDIVLTITYIDKKPGSPTVRGISATLLFGMAIFGIYNIYQAKLSYELSVRMAAWSMLSDSDSHSAIVSKVFNDLIELDDIEGLEIKERDDLRLTLDGCSNSFAPFLFSISNSACQLRRFTYSKISRSKVNFTKVFDTELGLRVYNGSEVDFHDIGRSLLTLDLTDSEVNLYGTEESEVFLDTISTNLKVQWTENALISVDVNNPNSKEELLALEGVNFEEKFIWGDKLYSALNISEDELISGRTIFNSKDEYMASDQYTKTLKSNRISKLYFGENYKYNEDKINDFLCYEYNGLPCIKYIESSTPPSTAFFRGNNVSLSVRNPTHTVIGWYKNSHVTIEDSKSSKKPSRKMSYYNIGGNENLYFLGYKHPKFRIKPESKSVPTEQSIESQILQKEDLTNIDYDLTRRFSVFKSSYFRLLDNKNIDFKAISSGSIYMLEDTEMSFSGALVDSIIHIDQNSSVKFNNVYFDDVVLTSEKPIDCSMFINTKGKNSIYFFPNNKCDFGKVINLERYYSYLYLLKDREFGKIYIDHGYPNAFKQVLVKQFKDLTNEVPEQKILQRYYYAYSYFPPNVLKMPKLN